eukprot:g24808.t1
MVKWPNVQVTCTDFPVSVLGPLSQEPYRPEDHQLTAEEFWGGLDDPEPKRPRRQESEKADGLRLQQMLSGRNASQERIS